MGSDERQSVACTGWSVDYSCIRRHLSYFSALTHGAKEEAIRHSESYVSFLPEPDREH